MGGVGNEVGLAGNLHQQAAGANCSLIRSPGQKIDFDFGMARDVVRGQLAANVAAHAAEAGNNNSIRLHE